MAGVWIWGAAAAIGISTLLLASHLLYRGFLLVSAGYLIYLGIKMLSESRHIQGLAADTTTPTRKGWQEFSRAFIVTFTNPKNGAFYVAILPQFLPENMQPIAGGLLLATIHNLECFIWFSMLIWGTNLARNFFARTQVRVWLERVSGIALIGFGIRMAMEAKS
jgi:threonine/homoserine/homoserine lactone efflux protein